jgi:hypothetical protein
MSRLEWILGGVLALLLVTALAVTAVFWLEPASPGGSTPAAAAAPLVEAKPAPTSIFAGRTAQIGYVLAERQARDWRADAQIVGATATWPQGATVENMLSGAADWGYTFYSPASGEVSIVSVTGERATRLTTGPATQPPTPIDVAGWQIDSSLAVAGALAQGGGEFVEREEIVSLVLTLGFNPQSSRLEWLVAWIGSRTGNSFTVQLDATTGEVIVVEQIP